ncbi:MAG: hypothetical protein K5851_05940 [Lachnospiraceae bacterium]|nr:hypothetical protein [Lachnospiraceae bacterium]
MKLCYRKKGIFALVLSFVMIVSSIIPMTVRAQDFDTDKPVIEDVIITPSADPLTADDKVDVTVKAYDAGSGISSISVFTPVNGYNQSSGVYYSKDNAESSSLKYVEDNTFKGSMDLNTFYFGGELNNFSIQVQDENGNTVFKNVPFKASFSALKNLNTPVSDISIKDVYVKDQNGERKDTNDICENDQLVVAFNEENVASKYSLQLTNSDAKNYRNGYLNSDYSVETNNVFYAYNDGYRSFKYDKILVFDLESNQLAGYLDISAYNVENKGKEQIPTEKARVTKITYTRDGKVLANGDKVKAGDKLNFKIYIDLDSNEDKATAEFEVAKKDVNKTESCACTYNKADKAFEGTLEITDNMYPSAWGLRYVYTNYNSYYLDNMARRYFVVQSEKTVLDTVNVHINVNYIAERTDGNGYYMMSLLKSFENIPAFTKLKDLKIDYSNDVKAVDGCKVLGYVVTSNNYNTSGKYVNNDVPVEDYVITPNDYSINVIPVYENNLTLATFNYRDKDLNIKSGAELFKNKDVDEISKALTEKYKDKIADEISDKSIKVNRINSIWATSGNVSNEIDGKSIINVGYDYLDKKGEQVYKSKSYLVKDPAKTVVDGFKKPTFTPEVPAGIVFKGWKSRIYKNPDGTPISIYYDPIFDGAIVKYCVSKDAADTEVYDDGEYIDVVSKPGKYSIKNELPGIGKVEVLHGDLEFDKNTVTLENGTYNYLYCQYLGASSDKPSKSEVKPSTPKVNPVAKEEPRQTADNKNTPNINEATNATEAEIAKANPATTTVVKATEGNDGGIKHNAVAIQKDVQDVTNAVAKASKTKAAQVTIDMKDGADIVPVEVLKAAKGHNVDVVLDMGGYSWTINGNDIKASNLKDINLKVEMNTNVVPSGAIADLAKGKDTQQISLRHEGDFGFKATLTMKAPEKEAGKFGNLFWYDSNHSLVFIDSNKVAADGSLSLEFSHASDYVIVYGDTQMGTKKSPKTGFDAFNIWYAYVMLLSAGSLLLVYGIYELNKEN